MGRKVALCGFKGRLCGGWGVYTVVEAFVRWLERLYNRVNAAKFPRRRKGGTTKRV